MTDQDWIDLGRRAVACRGWRWMPGMLSGEIGRVVYTDPDCPGALVSSGCPSGPDWEENLDPPDLRDPATVGCLLALVRDAYPNNDLCVDYLHTYRTCSGGVEHAVYEVHDQRYIPQLSRTNGGHPTEAHALVAALEAADGA